MGAGEIPLYPSFCNKISLPPFQKMLFWLLKDAQLASKRRPFDLLKTPFKNPIKHLLPTNFVTI